MKRFKKLTIYILVGVLLSSSVMLSYKKADVVKASATVTLGTGALIMIGLLGAYGIVYKGAIDSATGDYIWESALPKYEDDINELEQRFKLVWDSSVNQIASGGGYDPNDEWNGDENKPPKWDNLVDFVSKNQLNILKLGATVMSMLVANIAYQVYQESQGLLEKKEGVILGANDTLEFGFNYSDGSVNMGHKYQFNITQANDLKAICVEWKTSDNKYIGVLFASKNKFNLNYSYKYHQYLNDVTHWQNLSVGVPVTIYNYPAYGVDGTTIYIFKNATNLGLNAHVFNNNLPIVSIPYNLNDIEQTRQFLRELFTDEYTWVDKPNLLNEDNVGISSEIKIDGDNGTLEPILPVIQIPNNGTVGDLLGNLVIGTGNHAQTQLAVDQFVDSLQGTDPNPEGGTVPNPNPDPNPNPNPDPNPDDGEQGGEAPEEDKDNSSLLADLKNVFPFCIPFDLVNCFKLFNAEPSTPRVEIPLHFGIIDKDYTFVIDLKDFDGVAEVCRAMFLILFIVGLVLSTRSLIRG